MERLDKYQLHAKLEVPRLTWVYAVWGEHSVKSYLNRVLITILKIYIWARENSYFKEKKTIPGNQIDK